MASTANDMNSDLKESIEMPQSEQSRAPIAAAFARAKAEGRVALIPYVMAGYPDLATCEALALRLDQVGADIVELGVPFSDPLADGATIQAASQCALELGVTLEDTLALAGRLSERMRAPLVLTTYYNPIYSFGVAHFCEAASAAGVAGVIVPDLPPEEAEYMQETATPFGLELIFLVTPTSPDERIERVAQAAEHTGGFIYCVSLSGVTGARDQLPEGLAEFVARVRARTRLPLAVGFGVSRAEHIAEIGRIADGAVIASALLNAVDAAPEGERVAAGERFFRALQAGARRDQP
jgi:tryptophan synthase alpha chain